ncbi:MAG TPA: DUF6701 domain-containing protein, partial [Steroidobacteraceae bacterium]|nr:DUF6701 domain-containing protein [Steroidobacteraceae bacterium]
MARKKLFLRIFLALSALFVLEARAAAPAGAWWDGNYTYSQQISIPAGASALVTAYSTSVIFDHATQVAAGHSLANGNDVRIVYWNGTTWIELDRIADPDNSWNTSTTKIWFRTQAAIASGATDDNYYLYYGFTGSSTPSSTTPLSAWANIFLFYDDFTGASLDTTTRWTNSGATQAGGLLTIGNGSQIRSQSTFGVDTIWEARAKLSSASAPSGTAFYYWAANSSNNNNFTSPYLRFYASTIANHTANDSLAATPTQNFAPTTPTSLQNYSFTREGTTTARFLVNGTQVATFAHAASNTALRILLRNDTAAGQTQQYEWTRVRNYRNPEPVAALAAQTTFAPVAVASYSFEETSWNGTAGEVKDSSVNALNGTAKGAANTANTSPAIAGASVGTCRYATLNGTNSYVQVPTAAKLNITTAFGFAAWVRHHTNSYKTWETMLAKGDTAYRVHLNGGCNIASTLGSSTTNGLNEGLNGGCATADLNSNQIPAANTWYHLGATFRNGEMRIYVNGNLIASAAYSPPTIATNAFDLAIGENLQQTGRFWDGDIDEVTLWDQPVAQSTIQAHMAATHSCSTVVHFVIQNSAYGIHCVAQTITVNVRDAANNPVTTYNQQITLDTGTGKGDWSLVTGSGTLNNGTANDGIATYQWPLGESSAVFSLSYKEGAASTQIAAYQTNNTTIRDDGTAPAITWTPSGFTVTSSALSNPPPGVIPAFASPQVAGNNFTMYLTAYGTTPTDSQCGVIETYTGSKNLKFWSTYANPASGTRTVSINGAAIATAEGSSAAQAVTFTNGQANVTALYRDAGLISINMKDDTTGNPSLPTGIRGGTGNIVVRPSTFVLSNIKRTSDNFANPGAGTANGTVFIAAGQSFTATVTAMESGGTATPNFGQETPAESVGLTPAIVLPVGGQVPAIAASTGFGAFASGVATGTDFSWPEVGSI